MTRQRKPLTLFQKIWGTHVAAQQPDSPAVLYVDLHLVHEVTSPQAFTGLRAMNAQKETEQPRTFGGHGHYRRQREGVSVGAE